MSTQGQWQEQSQLQFQVQKQVIEQATLLNMTFDEWAEWLKSSCDDNAFVELADSLDYQGEVDLSGRPLVAWLPFNARAGASRHPARVSRTYIEEVSSARHDRESNEPSRDVTICDYLTSQLADIELELYTREIVIQVINNLDHNGYFRVSSYAGICGGACPPSQAEIEGALRIVQGLEPRGVGARTLEECLSLQLTDEMDFHEEIRLILQAVKLNELEHDADPLGTIGRLTGLSVELVKNASRRIATLHANPAKAFNTAVASHVRPFARFRSTDERKIEVELSKDWFPHIEISKAAEGLLRSGNLSASDKRHLKEAKALLKTVEDRRASVLEVLQFIGDSQYAFVNGDADFVQPLTRKRIAEELGRHHSTVCRIVQERWVETPAGIFRLDRLFSHPFRTGQGGEVSADWIRKRLKHIVVSEDKGSPLTDSQIQARINDLGVIFSRRTVEKYRKQLGIPTARQRAMKKAYFH